MLGEVVEETRGAGLHRPDDQEIRKGTKTGGKAPGTPRDGSSDVSKVRKLHSRFVPDANGDGRFRPRITMIVDIRDYKPPLTPENGRSFPISVCHFLV